MKRFFAFLLLAVMACTVCSCADEGKPSDYTFDELTAALAEANDLKEALLVTESTAKVHYQQSSLKKYDVDSTQSAQTAFRRGDDGKLLEMSGDYTVKTKEEERFSVYYKDGFAYYNQDDRFTKEALDASVLDDRSLFEGFGKDEIEAYSAKEKKGVITVTFRVPWESTSEKIVALYAQLADVMQSTGLTFSGVSYEDLSATYRIDKKTGKLKGYTYEYSATMKVDGKNVEVKGSATCTISKTSGVTITAPDLSLYN